MPIILFLYVTYYERIMNKIFNLGQKFGDKLMKSRQIGFSMKCFTADFSGFFTGKQQNLCGGWVLAIKPKHFRVFLEIF